MKFLIIGDIVGWTGIKKLKKEYQKLKAKYEIDFTIVNGENSAHGKGIRLKEYEEIMKLGVDVITMGNHLYYRKEMAEEYIKLKNLVIPANVTNLNGNGYVIVEKRGKKIAVINLIGQASMGEIFEKNTVSPFDKVEEILRNLKSQNIDYIFVDFHAEASAEKIAMGHFLTGKVTCVFGTHTHVQTADEKILNGKTAYITDVGMTGPIDSVIGLKKEVALERFVTGKFAKYECAEENESFLNGIVVETDNQNGLPITIERLQT
ncbi:MAG: TIGR00282 family metallophosphoesterase [Clostridia bacterium]|nr:TIGR00282 family metallophosphoesterase [Clostridia bacterium]